jgi:hypothetical protein
MGNRMKDRIGYYGSISNEKSDGFGWENPRAEKKGFFTLSLRG